MPDARLDQILAVCRSWPVEHVSAGFTDPVTTRATTGDALRVYRLASLTKVFTTWAILVALEEGSVTLEDPVGPPGSTLRHCLSHASGYPFDGREPIAPVGSRRIYSNTGIEAAAEHVASRTGVAFTDYLSEAILAPLGLDRSELSGSPAHGLHSCLRDMLIFCREILAPTLLSTETVDIACRAQFPGLAGVVPGMGSFDPNPWGLGVEIRGDKYPHWMGSHTSTRTFGHFGGAGTMFWVDPIAGLALVALTNRPFDEWADSASRLWSELSDAVIDYETSS